MKKMSIFLCFSFLLLPFAGCSDSDNGTGESSGGDGVSLEDIRVIPLPQFISYGRGAFAVDKDVTISCTAAKAGATYVSPFVGRLDDICNDGVGLVAQIVELYQTYDYKTQVLAASIRNTLHILQCAEVGADVVTCPLSAIKGLLNHPLTDIGLEKFLADYKKVNG